MFITPDASGWYARHKTRNNEISDTIEDVKYSEQFGVSSTKMTSEIMLGIAGGLLIFGLVGGLGLGVFVLGLYANSGELAGLGIAGFCYGTYEGASFAGSHYNDAKNRYKKEMNPSDKYRFVRFLPEYSWLGWSNKRITAPLKINSGERSYSIPNTTVISNNGANTIMGYFPDSQFR